MLAEKGDDQGPGIVVGAVAVIAVGNVEAGVLKNAGLVGEDMQVVETRRRQREVRRLQGSRLMDARSRAPFVARLAKDLEILRADIAPHHVAGKGVGLLAHRLALRVVRQEIDDFRGDGLAVAERHQPAASVGEHLLGIAVGGRDDRLAGTERIAQDARDDLLAIEVGRDADIGGGQEVGQRLDVEELVVEDDMLADAELRGARLERVPVGFALLALDARMGLADDDEDRIRVRLRRSSAVPR